MASTSKQKKHLRFDALRSSLSNHFDNISDFRQSGKNDYSIHDTLMSGFACMYFQDPSLLHFQQRLEKKHQRNNLQTIFRVKHTPQNSQMRDVIDNIPSSAFEPIFKDYYERLRRHKHLEDYAVLPNMLMCVADGTQYHTSKTVHCDCCLHKKHKNGDITYSHTVLQGAIMHPDKKQVIPVMPEAIKNSDGDKKQDCESKAMKRFIKNLREAHPRQDILLAGDGLMSHQPLIEAVLADNMHYLFVAKPGDHKYMFEWIDAFKTLPSREYTDDKGRLHRFTWKNKVPLHGQANAIEVNYIEYQQIKEGKITFKNSWVTDIEITQDNAIRMAKAGRCRWKIENECFNSLKNQGYNLEHNYGHGKKHLSYNMYLLTLLAFFFHQIFELTDGVYQACRVSYGSKRHLWENFRSTIRMVLIDSWDDLMDLLLNEDDWEVTAVKNS